MLVKECPKDSGYGSSINFIDSNDVFAGFDMDQYCCENFGWRVEDFESGEVLVDSEQSLEVCNKLLECYDFTKYFVEHEPDHGEDGGSLEMILSNPKGSTLRLFFYNYHNGYYSHGFNFKTKEKVIIEGYL